MMILEEMVWALIRSLESGAFAIVVSLIAIALSLASLFI